MNIGITCYPTYGGSGAVATELGIALAKRGHEVHFISYAQPFRLSGFHERVYFHEVELERYPLFETAHYTLALAASIHDIAMRAGLDLVHVHYAIPHATSAWIAREMLDDAPPLVTTLHGTDVTLVGRHPSFRAITRFSILRSQAITAVSKYLRGVTAQHFDIPGDAVQVIPNFVDTRLFRPRRTPPHRAVLAPGGERIVMHVSNFRPVKRVTDVIDFFAAVRRRVPSRLVMVGDGPDRPRAVRRAAEHGVERDVAFLGKYAAVEELLPCADLFVITSDSESFGLAALEAMSCGVPVLGYRAGGLPEVVEDGECGFLVPALAAEQLGEAGLRLLEDAALRERFSRAARKIAVDAFALDRVLPSYEAVYHDLLRAR